MEVPLNAWEQSLEVQLLRCGVERHCLNDPWTRYPGAVIGQAAGGRVTMQLEGRAPVRVPPYGGYAVPSNALQRSRNEPGTTTVYHWSHMSFTVLGAVDLFQIVEIPLVLPRKTGEEIGAVVAQQLALLESAEPQSLTAIARRRELNFRTLRLLLRHARVKESAAALLSGHARIQPALDYMQAHLAERVTRGQLARSVFLSESRFHDTFRRATGQAPLHYLQTLRLRCAQELLLSGDASIAEVGRRSGFADQFHFSRIFKAACGQSPRAYRVAARRWSAQ